jgi:hypothetical protein
MGINSRWLELRGHHNEYRLMTVRVIWNWKDSMFMRVPMEGHTSFSNC